MDFGSQLLSEIDKDDAGYKPVKTHETDTNVIFTRDPSLTVIGAQETKGEAEKAAEGTETTQRKGWRGKRSQLLACSSIQAVGFMAGLALSHSASLIPQLEAPGSDFQLNRFQSAWIASVITITVPLGSVVGGWLTDRTGRLTAAKLSTIPYLAACIVVATAQSFAQLLAGRLLLGASLGIAMNASMLYTTEVAEKEIRGGLSCLGTAIASLGILLGYTAGAFIAWRTTSWCFCAAPLLFLGLLFAFAAESPAWLRERGKIEAARKASMYFYQDPEKVLSAPKAAKSQNKELSLFQKITFLVSKPTGLKPFVLINLLFLLQQLTGVYITLCFAVSFFQEAGSRLDPYIATILLGAIRLVFVTGTSLTAGRFGRRPLMIASSLGMGICMLSSALTSQRILGNPEAPSWMSNLLVSSIMMYMAFAGIGMQVLPWAMMAEVFPHEVRSVAQPLNMSTSHVLMFSVLQLYPSISYWLGGTTGAQFLFAGCSLFSAAFVWLFLLETRGLTLQEIEEYFQQNTIYPGHKRRQLNGKTQPA